MANPDHIKALIQGKDAWDEWYRKNADDVNYGRLKTDLSGVILNIELLHDIWFERVDFSSTEFHVKSIADCVFRNCNLDNASFKNTFHLVGNKFRYCSMNGTDFSGTHLDECLFAHNYDELLLLNSTDLDDVTFCNCDLSQSKGLMTCEVGNPCTIGVETLYRSNGQIPHEFLLEAGVQENLIEYMDALTADNPIQFDSIFISHSTVDRAFASRLYAAFRNEKIRVWYAPEEMEAGKKLHEQIDQAISFHDRLLLVLSDASMKSSWVETEIIKAREKELRTGNRVLFPISIAPFTNIRNWSLFNGDEGRDIAREIRGYYIPDFTNWKDQDKFTKEFKKLLSAIKKAED